MRKCSGFHKIWIKDKKCSIKKCIISRFVCITFLFISFSPSPLTSCFSRDSDSLLESQAEADEEDFSSSDEGISGKWGFQWWHSQHLRWAEVSERTVKHDILLVENQNRGLVLLFFVTRAQKTVQILLIFGSPIPY